MVIAVENGLDDVKNYLYSRGFTVVELDGANVYDAVVYKNTGIYHIPVSNQAGAKASAGTQGAFLVCASGRTPEEIEKMLRQKAYGNLF